MALFLKKKELRSKRFIENEIFKCMIPGSENPTDRNWMTATYISSKLENGVKLGIHSSCSLFWVIKPFTEGLFRTTFYHRNSINSDYAIVFKIEIKNEEEFVQAGEFYYRSDKNPFEPETKTNWDLFRYLDQPFKILVTTSFFCFYSFDPYFLEPENDEESVPPKPLEKTFKFDQCVICLDRKPDVLLIKCNHICVCKDCEKTHPSTQCPYCRAKVSRRLLI